MKRIFITGATGYIGHQLALTAAARGYLVSALVRDTHSPNLPVHPAIRFVKGDLLADETVIKAMEQCEYVLHAAGLTQLWHKDRSLFYRTHVTGTRNVLEAARFHGVEKLVLTSSCAVLGPSESRPLAENDLRFTPFENDYEISKHCAEELVKEYVRRGLPAVIVALPRVYGPGLTTKGNPISRLIQRTLERRFAVVPAEKNIVGNYVYIDDVVNGHFAALEKGESGEKYILGGENISYQQLFETVARVSQKNLKILAMPVALLKLWSGLVFGLHYLSGRHTHLSPKVVKRLLQNRAVTSEKAIRQLNYQITPFERGIEQTIHHLNALHHG